MGINGLKESKITASAVSVIISVSFLGRPSTVSSGEEAAGRNSGNTVRQRSKTVNIINNVLCFLSPIFYFTMAAYD